MTDVFAFIIVAIVVGFVALIVLAGAGMFFAAVLAILHPIIKSMRK